MAQGQGTHEKVRVIPYSGNLSEMLFTSRSEDAHLISTHTRMRVHTNLEDAQ
jgi:hypothetical protein